MKSLATLSVLEGTEADVVEYFYCRACVTHDEKRPFEVILCKDERDFAYVWVCMYFEAWKEGLNC